MDTAKPERATASIPCTQGDRFRAYVDQIPQPYRSAPELLEALREIKRLCSAAANDGKSAAVRESNVNQAWHVASAAIAAATGEG